MANPVNMPPLGESVTEGTVTRWLKQVGDRVEQDEPLVEIATDKVDTEIPSPVAGVLLEISVPEDETAEVGAQIAVIGEESEAGGDGGSGGDGGQESDGQESDGQESDGQDSGGEQASADDEPEDGPSQDAEDSPGDRAADQEDAGQPAEAPSQEADAPAEKPHADTQQGDGGTEIVMPALGESVTEGTITRWLKSEGDTVEVDEPIVEVSTDKVDTEVPSPVGGTVLRILVQEDETAEVGAPLVVVGDASQQGGGSQDEGSSGSSEQAPAADAEDAAEEAPPTGGGDGGHGDGDGDASPEQTPGTPEAKEQAADAAGEGDRGPSAEDSAAGQYNSPEPQVPSGGSGESGESAGSGGSGQGMSAVGDQSGYITPIVRKLAAEKGVDLSGVTGSGVGGRIRRQDVLAAAEAAEKAASAPAQEASAPAAQGGAQQPAAAQAPAPAAEISAKRGTREKMSRLRKVIAQRMVESLQVSAQLTTVVEVDVTRVAALRNRAKNAFAEREGVKLSFLPFFALAAVEALKQYPVVNASIDGEEIVYHGAEHLGIAVDTERGLLVPVIKDAGDLNIGGLARKIADLAARTRDNKVSPDELSGGTFTLTNTGSRGALFDTPILNQPQVGILGTGSVVKRPMVVPDSEGNDSIAIRSMVYLALSYDHRIVDGADAARFLSTVKQRLEDGAFESDLGL
jgi:pyruvate dehydrogenase E2 component (dihydrolipoamide acetyltransferase)